MAIQLMCFNNKQVVSCYRHDLNNRKPFSRSPHAFAPAELILVKFLSEKGVVQRTGCEWFCAVETRFVWFILSLKYSVSNLNEQRLQYVLYVFITFCFLSIENVKSETLADLLLLAVLISEQIIFFFYS